jgi:hypothetical protein
LHHKPVNCLLVLPVNSCGFNKLGFDAGDGVGMLVCVLE